MSDQNHSIYCAANGCPMLGSLSRGTTGGAEFWCFLHFGAKADRWHAITAELQRLGWLVKITQQVRAAGPGFDVIEKAANKEITLNQSSHLLRGDHESLAKWLRRLEDTLRIACAEQKEFQQPLDV